MLCIRCVQIFRHDCRSESNATQFGYGPRVCVGKNLATVEIHKFIADFVHRYNARFINPYRPYVVKSQWFSYQADMFLKLELRDTVSKQA